MKSGPRHYSLHVTSVATCELPSADSIMAFSRASFVAKLAIASVLM